MIASPAETVSDLLDRLGGIPASRVRLKPAPGTATEADLIAALDGEPKLLCELIDGVLVEKAVGAPEGLQGGLLSRRLGNYAEDHDLGLVFPADTPFRFNIGLVRLPDVSFVPWERVPGDEFPTDAVSRVIPTLAVEVLSRKNTRAEIARKLGEYFDAGVELAWVINPRTKTARVHTAAKTFEELDAAGVLDGGRVVPGFRLPLADVFAAGTRRKKRPR
ncbi:MAG: Uma2 family endonuclease [Gemmataceae bacterium]|nr:Uma2 family endonuclease [Gemmataceae bacterium]